MDHVREHRSLLAAAEKRLLIAIAHRLPRWMCSDHLTQLALLSMPTAGLGFVHLGTAAWGAPALALALRLLRRPRDRSGRHRGAPRRHGRGRAGRGCRQRWVSVELAVVHNFLWHARGTWRDRLAATAGRFVRFQLANRLASIAGNAALMALFAGGQGLPPVPASALAVAAMSVVKFVAADRWVFRARGGARLAVMLCYACLALPSPRRRSRLPRGRVTSPPRGSRRSAAPTTGSSGGSTRSGATTRSTVACSCTCSR